jgi:rod shape-determining protein MreD
MLLDTLRRLLIFVLLVLAQGLVFNRIQLFHCATPLLYVYFVITFRRNYPKWASLLWAFALGLCVDMFSNTPGLAAASTTLMAAIQPYLLLLFLPREAEEHLRPSAATLGFGKFFTMATIMVLLFCLTFFALEAFNFYDWQQWLLCVVGSAALTLVLIMALESLRR